jgi:tetrahydromethanopterin:alpha-L-glutamate ligase
MRIGVAGVPGAWSSEQLADALQRERIESFVFSLSDCVHDLTLQRVTLHGFDLAELDAIVVKKIGGAPTPESRLRLHLLRALDAEGVRIYSKPSVIERVMDRYRMTMMLISAGLPVPKTFAVESELGLREAAVRLGDAVVKPIYSSKGRGFVRLGNGSMNSGQESRAGAVLAQRFVEAPGRDIGACVLAGRFVGAFYRVAAEGQWLTTTSAGGCYAPCELPRDARLLAEDAATVFGLDYTVVDLVEQPNGYLIYEVSAFGGFRGLWEAYRHNIATKYASYIKSDLQG